MKKLFTTMVALMMCLSLAACGGSDKSAAKEAFNKASASFNEASAVINANPDEFPQELIDVMIQMADVLNQHQQKLSSDEDIDEETLNEMIEWYGQVEEWVDNVKAIMNS